MKTRIRFSEVGDGERGLVLLYALVGAFVAAGMAAVMVTLAGTASDRSVLHRDGLRARYLAEGAVEAAKKDILAAIANWSEPPAGGQVTIDGTAVDYSIVPTGFNQVVVDPSGVQTSVEAFQIRAGAAVGQHSAVAHRIVNAEATPVFQFAVFYTSDLEIHPGPNMTLGGRVHTNGDMYLGCGGVLTVDSNYLRSVGSIYRRRKNNPDASEGAVMVRRWVPNPFDPGAPAEFEPMYSESQLLAFGVPSESGYDTDFTSGWDGDGNGSYFDPGDFLPWNLGALEYWKEPDGYTEGHGNTVMTAEHGMTEAATPAVQSIAMFDEAEGGDHVWDEGLGEYVEVAPGTGTHEKGYFHGEADLVVITFPDGSWEARDGSGNRIPEADLEGVITIEEMYDARQADGADEKVRVTEIDMEALGESGHFPANGLLYASSYGLGEGTDAAGVRLANGAELAAPLAVVSEGSLYVHGDYNTVGKKGASVIADAVNLLSNDWDDSKEPGTLPKAAETTFNLAMITGNYETQGLYYNGGLENLPRFHEDWTGVECTITGSFVNTWDSQYATGFWQYASDRYTAPDRNWNYDTDFNDVANLPPYTPIVVTAVDVVSW